MATHTTVRAIVPAVVVAAVAQSCCCCFGWCRYFAVVTILSYCSRYSVVAAVVIAAVVDQCRGRWERHDCCACCSCHGCASHRDCCSCQSLCNSRTWLLRPL